MRVMVCGAMNRGKDDRSSGNLELQVMGMTDAAGRKLAVDAGMSSAADDLAIDNDVQVTIGAGCLIHGRPVYSEGRLVDAAPGREQVQDLGIFGKQHRVLGGHRGDDRGGVNPGDPAQALDQSTGLACGDQRLVQRAGEIQGPVPCLPEEVRPCSPVAW
jgi:hypothetical protein